MKQAAQWSLVVVVLAGALMISDRIGLSHFLHEWITGGKQSQAVFEAYRNTKLGRDNELGAFCIEELNRQTNATAKGQEFKFVNAEGNDVAGRYIVQASAAFVTVVNPTTYGAPNVVVTCEYQGNELVAIHQIRDLSR